VIRDKIQLGEREEDNSEAGWMSVNSRVLCPLLTYCEEQTSPEDGFKSEIVSIGAISSSGVIV
ncbi:hypothetical protein BgiMline_032916, partial [Biomphalaria glabrata]